MSFVNLIGRKNQFQRESWMKMCLRHSGRFTVHDSYNFPHFDSDQREDPEEAAKAKVDADDQ